MRVAALYDIHGNLPALEAVLGDVSETQVDQVVVGGDVLPGPLPRETIARLLDLDIPLRFIMGNGDRAVLAQMTGATAGDLPEAAQQAIRWTARQLDSRHERLLAGWPPSARITVRGLGDVLFCHATPRNDTEIFTSATREEALVPVFAEADAPLVVCGHTHMQFDRTIGKTRVVNAGSVGMPFGQPGAYWLLLGPAVELRRTPYDQAQAAERIRHSGYPQAEEFASRHVLRPPSQEEMRATFARAELK